LSRTTYKNAPKSYRSALAINNLIHDLLLYRDKHKELYDGIHVDGMGQEDIDAGRSSLKKMKASLNKRKVDVLNKHIFPAMANLTVLVEAMQEESYIRGKFENDVRQLFLTKSSKRGKDNKSIFERFIAASCTLTVSEDHRTKEKEKILAPDWRLLLLDIMQRTIYRKMDVIAKLKFDSPDSRDELLAEMKTATRRTGEFAHKAKMKEMTDGARRKKHSKSVRRPALF